MNKSCKWPWESYRYFLISYEIIIFYQHEIKCTFMYTIHRTLSNQYSECYAKFTTRDKRVLFDCLMFPPSRSLLSISRYLIFFFSFLFFSFLLFPCSNDKQLTHGQLHTFERLSFLLFSKPYIPWSFHPLSWFIFRLIITRLVFHEPTLDHFNIYTTFCKSWINVFSNFYNTSTEFKIV